MPAATCRPVLLEDLARPTTSKAIALPRTGAIPGGCGSGPSVNGMADPHTHRTHDQPVMDGAEQAKILDLDAEVLADHLASITAWLPVQAIPREIVDLGCGTGAGTLALLARFPRAHVTAVDAAAGHLGHLEDTAHTMGLGDQVDTVEADLDAADWPHLGTPDLVWASASMHHLADPDRALRQVHDLLAPHGLFAVVELAGFPRFLPDSSPEDRPGLEQRCHAAAGRSHTEHVPHRGADWEPKLAAAGFTIEHQLTVSVNIPGSRSEAVGRYALTVLQRLRETAAHALEADDLAALDQLLDTTSPRSILRRHDLAVRTERTVWAARRSA